jgi:hypothetical protein
MQNIINITQNAAKVHDFMMQDLFPDFQLPVDLKHNFEF